MLRCTISTGAGLLLNFLACRNPYYAGGAGVAISLLMLEYATQIHLNDINPSVYAFWQSVLKMPDELCALISKTDVTVDEWRKQKVVQSKAENHSFLELGFSTFFLNRTIEVE